MKFSLCRAGFFFASRSMATQPPLGGASGDRASLTYDRMHYEHLLKIIFQPHSLSRFPRTPYGNCLHYRWSLPLGHGDRTARCQRLRASYENVSNLTNNDTFPSSLPLVYISDVPLSEREKEKNNHNLPSTPWKFRARTFFSGNFKFRAVRLSINPD